MSAILLAAALFAAAGVDQAAAADAGEQQADAGAPAAEAPVAATQVPEGAPAESEGNLVEVLFELDAQLNQMVVSSTKTEQRARQAPAVITVVTAEEIQVRGYRNLADILRSVPGFYDVFDLSTHNVGIRGVNGGARASGSLLKLMIDGQSVPFRPSTGNFFGEELIPLEVVDRVEIIRGPGSALYGANAFLGVVNVITRSGRQREGVGLTLGGGLERTNPGGGVGLRVGLGNEQAEMLVAAQGLYLDRSGLTLASTSPLLQDGAASATSSSDLARPKSLFGRASVEVAGGTLAMLASLQSLDTGGEFQDFAPLSHRTRYVMDNQTYRLSYDRALGETGGLKLSLTYLRSTPGASERLGGAEGLSYLRRVQTDGIEVALEGRVRPLDSLQLVGGIDHTWEGHRTQSFDLLLEDDLLAADGSVLRAAGTVIPGTAGARQDFYTFGAFALALWSPLPELGVSVGARLDRNSVYGVQFSPRAGLVWAPPDGAWSVKLLYGSSFKAPSAEQLYTQPMRALDVRGNARLEAQRAQTGELVGSLQLGNAGEVLANVFVTSVTGRVEYQQRGLYQSALNAVDEVYVGGELDARYRLFGNALGLQLGVGVAKLVSQAERSTVPVTGGPEAEQPLFPVLQAHLTVDWRIPVLGLRLVPEVSWVGGRPASQSNALQRDEAYEVAGYVYTALALSLPEREGLFGGRVSASLKGTDLLGTATGEPGFGGVDVPARGRTVWLTLSHGF